HPDTARGYNDIAYNLHAQGNYAGAEPLFRKALTIRQKVLGEDHPDTGASYNDMSINLTAQRKYPEAELLGRKGLAIARKVLGEDHSDTAQGYHNVADNLNAQGRYAEAEPLYGRALAICQKVLGEDHPYTATGYTSVATSLQNQGKYAEAEPRFRRALAIWQKVLGEDHPYTATGYTNVAYSLQSQGKYPEAEPLWLHAAGSLEASRLRFATTGFERAAAVRAHPHLGWAVCLACQGRPAEAWRPAEASLARGLLDDFAARELLGSSPEQEQRRRTRAARLAELDRLLLPLLTASALSTEKRVDRAALLEERQALAAELDREAADQARRQVYSLERIQQKLPADAAFVFWVDWRNPSAADPGAWHWGCVVRSVGQPAWERLPGSGPGHAWTANDDELPSRLGAALAQHSPEWRSLAHRLAEQRLGPLQPHLGALGSLRPVTRLVVAPIWPMAGVPVELLTEHYQISYAPSGTVFARLAEGRRPLSETSLLAVGDPIFLAPDSAPHPTPPDYGLLLVHVLRGGNADKAGIRDGDVLLAYAGAALHRGSDLHIQETGEPVAAEVWHSGQTRAVQLASNASSRRCSPQRAAPPPSRCRARAGRSALWRRCCPPAKPRCCSAPRPANRSSTAWRRLAGSRTSACSTSPRMVRLIRSRPAARLCCSPTTDCPTNWSKRAQDKKCTPAG
ncbi:MAG: tetratricopeptide repeat protein, partial [Planctomycetota bacterium]